MTTTLVSDLTQFTHQAFGDVRTLLIEGKPYFVAKDIAIALGYSNFRDAIIRHCRGVVKRDSPTSGGNQELSFIPQGDVIRLVMRSKLPGAARFESWVCDEVVPAILRTGTYHLPGTVPTVTDPATLVPAIAALLESTRVIAEGLRAVDSRLDRIDQRLAALEHARAAGPALVTPIEDSRRIQSFANPSDEEIASDMLRLVAHLAELVRRDHGDPAAATFTAREIITRAAKLRCFRRILRGRFLADGTFEATPAARSTVGKLLSQRFGQIGFILDDGKPVFLRHNSRGRGRRYFLTPDN